VYLVCSCSFVFHFPPIRLCSLEKPEAYLSLLNCACDWPNFLGGMYRALGTTSQDPKISRRVNVDYTLSAASSFSQLPHPAGTKFRFVYCSGIAAVRDQEKKLWFLSEGRKIRVCLSNFRPFPRLFIFSLTIPLSPSTPFRPLTPPPAPPGPSRNSPPRPQQKVPPILRPHHRPPSDGALQRKRHPEIDHGSSPLGESRRASRRDGRGRCERQRNANRRERAAEASREEVA